MGQLIDVARLALPLLARNFRRARPFPHVAIDGFLAPEALAELRAAFDWEQHFPQQDDIYSFLASADPPRQALLRQFGEELSQKPMRAAVEAITGRATTHADVRGFVYLPGHYLLPHTDGRASFRRAVAYVYYLDLLGPLRGGDLLLFKCSLRGEEVSRAKPTRRIVPKRNRLLLFEVTHASLHQVREVLQGARMSLAGWFIS